MSGYCEPSPQAAQSPLEESRGADNIRAGHVRRILLRQKPRMLSKVGYAFAAHCDSGSARVEGSVKPRIKGDLFSLQRPLEAEVEAYSALRRLALKWKIRNEREKALKAERLRTFIKS